MGPCIVSIFQYISDKIQCYSVYLYLETALHVSGGTCIYVYIWKHVEQFPDISKLCNVASCWIYTYIGILLGAHPILHISRVKVNQRQAIQQKFDLLVNRLSLFTAIRPNSYTKGVFIVLIATIPICFYLNILRVISVKTQLILIYTYIF
jgi:hypothetical protein